MKGKHVHLFKNTTRICRKSPFWDMVIEKDGKEVVKKSAERYLRAIGR
jgi:heat shock protein HspQ